MQQLSNETLRISGGQYSLYRWLLGAYLMVHFGFLAGYAGEVFSNAGMLANASLSPLFDTVPSLLWLSDAPWMVTALALSAALAAALFAAGRFDRPAATWMLLVLITLFCRNPLIANPALPYVGFMLLLHLFVPAAPYGALAARGRADPGAGWTLPAHLFFAATAVLALSYSYSGYTKLLSPGWVLGDTVSLVLQNPLARDWFVRDLLLWIPEGVLRALTWFILYVELLFAPLYLIRTLRPWLWLGMLCVQLGFLMLLRFPDLTVPMLLFHLLTFDPRWLMPRPFTDATLHFDGNCGVCHRAVRFSLAEAPAAGLRFRPMQRDGALAARDATSWRLAEANGVCFEKTAAVIRLLHACGGTWSLLGGGLALVPERLRDAAYDALARHRRRLLRVPDTLCPVVDAHLHRRFL